MTVFKVISIQGTKPFAKRKIELLVHERAVNEILALLEQGKKLLTTSDHNYIYHCFFTFQSTHFGDEKQIVQRLVYFPEEIVWLNWLNKITPRLYSLENCSIGELVNIFQDIEVIKFNYQADTSS